MKGPGADERYWQALREGHLEMQQCDVCARWNWPAVWRCGECGSWEHSWHPVPLHGRIFSWTRTWHDFGAPREFALPFVSVLVALDGADHRRLLGTLAVGPDETVRCGTEVVGEIIELNIDGAPLPALRWRLASPQPRSEGSV